MKKATIKAIVSILGGLVVFSIAFYIFQSLPRTTEATMTRQDAERIAQDQFQGEVVSVEFDDGRYEVELETEDAQYELEIDAKTGAIVKLEEKRVRQQTVKNTELTDEKRTEKEVEVTEKETKVEVKQEQSKNTSKEKEVTNKEEQPVKKTTKKQTKNVIISSDEAIKIAHEQVPNAKVIDIELESDDGQRYYEIEMHTDDQEVDIEIDAYTGKVIMIEFERLEGSSKAKSDLISIEKAKQIALDKEPNAKIIEAKLDSDDGYYYYEIEMETEQYEIDLEIDAYTGKILDIDYDDRD